MLKSFHEFVRTAAQFAREAHTARAAAALEWLKNSEQISKYERPRAPSWIVALNYGRAPFRLLDRGVFSGIIQDIRSRRSPAGDVAADLSALASSLDTKDPGMARSVRAALHDLTGAEPERARGHAILAAMILASDDGQGSLWNPIHAGAIAVHFAELSRLMGGHSPERALEFAVAYFNGWGRRSVDWSRNDWEGIPGPAAALLHGEILFAVHTCITWMSAPPPAFQDLWFKNCSATGERLAITDDGRAPIADQFDSARVLGSSPLRRAEGDLAGQLLALLREQDAAGCQCWTRAGLFPHDRIAPLPRSPGAPTRQRESNLVEKAMACGRWHRLSSWDPVKPLVVFVQIAIKGFSGAMETHAKQFAGGMLQSALANMGYPILLIERTAHWMCPAHARMHRAPVCEAGRWNGAEHKVSVVAAPTLILPDAAVFVPVRYKRCNPCGNIALHSEDRCPLRNCSGDLRHEPGHLWVYVPRGAKTKGLLGVHGDSAPFTAETERNLQAVDSQIATLDRCVLRWWRMACRHMTQSLRRAAMHTDVRPLLFAREGSQHIWDDVYSSEADAEAFPGSESLASYWESKGCDRVWDILLDTLGADGIHEFLTGVATDLNEAPTGGKR